MTYYAIYDLFRQDLAQYNIVQLITSEVYGPVIQFPKPTRSMSIPSRKNTYTCSDYSLSYWMFPPHHHVLLRSTNQELDDSIISNAYGQPS